MKKLIVSPRIPPEGVEALRKIGYHLCFTKPCSFFSPPVADHPDLQFFRHPDGVLRSLGITALEDARERGEECRFAVSARCYENEAKLNLQSVGNLLLGNKKLCFDFSFPPNFEFIHVNQGYARCSSISIGERSLITDDEGIATAAKIHGIEALLISKGGVRLSGYPYGFIGGASFVCGQTVYFFGEPMTHPDGEEILRFVRARSLECVSLWDGPLTDYGSAVPYT